MVIFEFITVKVKKTHLCFHCLRVTYVNRLRRAGVPREVAMRLVNHASELIHQIYQREKVEDLVQWRDAVQFPTGESGDQASKNDTPASTGSQEIVGEPAEESESDGFRTQGRGRA